jgi:hypothetical protein
MGTLGKYYTYCDPIVLGCILYKDPEMTQVVDDGYYNDGKNCMVVDSQYFPNVPGRVIYSNKNCLLPICFEFGGQSVPIGSNFLTSYPQESDKYNNKYFYQFISPIFGYLYWSDAQKLWIHASTLGETDLSKVYSTLDNKSDNYPVSNDINKWNPTNLGLQILGIVDSVYGFCS